MMVQYCARRKKRKRVVSRRLIDNSEVVCNEGITVGKHNSML